MTGDEIIHSIREQNTAGELPPPTPPEAVAGLEIAVGHPMPPLLKRIHLGVADGGFGRRGEALSLTDTSYSFSDSGRLLEEYLGWRGALNHPPSVVLLLTWGCEIWSLVDYSTPEGRMWFRWPLCQASLRAFQVCRSGRRNEQDLELQLEY